MCSLLPSDCFSLFAGLFALSFYILIFVLIIEFIKYLRRH